MERRVILFFVLSFVIIFGTQIISNKLYPPPPAPPVAAEQTPAPGTSPAASPATTSTTPVLTAASTPAPGATPTPAATPSISRANAPRVNIKTDAYNIEISAKGAVPVRWDVTDQRFVVAAAEPGAKPAKGAKGSEPLIDPAIADSDLLPHPFSTVLEDTGNNFYRDFNDNLYTTAPVTRGAQFGYKFTSPVGRSGLRMTKTYLFSKNGFTGTFEIELANEGKYNLTFDRGGDAGLGVVVGPGLGHVPEDYSARTTVVEPAVLGSDGVFYGMPAMGSEVTYPGGQIEWGGLHSMYFMTVLMPQAPTVLTSAHVVLDPNLPSSDLPEKVRHFFPHTELYSKAFTLQAGSSQKFSYQFFFGPMQRNVLVAADHNLTRAQFFHSWEWMRALCIGLMKMLAWLFTIFRNYGVAIIVLTIIVRIITFPLVQKGMKSQAKMMAEQQRLKPLMDKINEKYKSDPQRKQQEIFKLYKEHGVNPFGAFKGCVWLLIQMPILYGLYYVINQSVELRGATFLWIADLSQPDRLFHFSQKMPLLGQDFNLLPLIMVVVQMLTSKFSMQPSTDPQQQQMQKTMTYMMPLMMLFIFYSMPSGLVLYWTVSNIWQVAQQYWVNKHIKKPQAPGAPPGAPAVKTA